LLAHQQLQQAYQQQLAEEEEEEEEEDLSAEEDLDENKNTNMHQRSMMTTSTSASTSFAGASGSGMVRQQPQPAATYEREEEEEAPHEDVLAALSYMKVADDSTAAEAAMEGERGSPPTTQVRSSPPRASGSGSGDLVSHHHPSPFSISSITDSFSPNTATTSSTV
jgi:hypothetical protein